MDASQFADLFHGRPVPSPLARLLDFQTEIDTQYVQGLWLTDRETGGLISGWSDAPAFLQRLIAFGVANASGSFYALWDPADGTTPDQWPVVVFGDEGGEWVVADSVTELLQLAALDVEPMVMHDGVTFYIDDEDDEDSASEGAEAYRRWLKNTLDLGPVEEPETVVDAAQSRWQAAFDAWKKPFLAHWEDADGDNAPAAAENETPERQLLMAFVQDEAGSMPRATQGTFWPTHRDHLLPLIPQADRWLAPDECAALYFHLLRVDHCPGVTSEEALGELVRAYEGLRSLIWRGPPVCALSMHAGMFLFGSAEYGVRLPDEPLPTLPLYTAWRAFHERTRTCATAADVPALAAELRALSADAALVARVGKTLLHETLREELHRPWLWAFVFLALHDATWAEPVAAKLRDEASAANDTATLDMLDRLLEARAGT